MAIVDKLVSLASLARLSPKLGASGGYTAGAAAQAVLAPSSVLSYGNSFVRTPGVKALGMLTAPRFAIDSICTIWNAQTAVTFYVCESCKSERVFRRSRLFLEDNYDFRPVISEEVTVVFRRRKVSDADYRTVVRDGSPWGKPEFLLREATCVPVNTTQELQRAWSLGLPLVARTLVEASGISVLLEYPVKTLNVKLEKDGACSGEFQVDTGHVVLPDMAQPLSEAADSLRLAFVAFSDLEHAEFIFEEPTPAGRNAPDIRVNHFSTTERHAAENRLFAVVDSTSELQ